MNMKEDIKWISEVYGVSKFEAFFVLLFIKWKRARAYSDPLRTTEIVSDTYSFDD